MYCTQGVLGNYIETQVENQVTSLLSIFSQNNQILEFLETRNFLKFLNYIYFELYTSFILIQSLLILNFFYACKFIYWHHSHPFLQD
jgi:hypothetical protein